MALFPRCNNPVPVVGRHGVTLVGCHSCIQCRVAAQEHLCKILEVEASKHKYVEFLTNTYDDKHLPYIDTSYMYPFGYALRIPNRVIKKYNRKTKEFYFVEDKISKSFQLVNFDTIDTAAMLNEYYTRIDKYFSRFPLVKGVLEIILLSLSSIMRIFVNIFIVLENGLKKSIMKLYATTLFASTVHNLSVHITIFYYSTIRLSQEQISDMFGLSHNPRRTTPAKFVLNSIWLNYGSMVIRLQRLPMAVCKNTLVNILHSILTSLECLVSFHRGLFTQSYLVQKTEWRLNNYSRLGISKHLQQIMLLTRKVSDTLFPCRMRITLNCPSDLQVLPVLVLMKLLPFFVQWYTAPNGSLPHKEKSTMTDT